MNYQLFFNVDENRKGKSFFPMQTVPPPFVPVGILHKGKTLNFTVDEFDELLRSGLNKEVDNSTSTNKSSPKFPQGCCECKWSVERNLSMGCGNIYGDSRCRKVGIVVR